MRLTDKDKIKELMKLKSCNVLLTDNDNKELKLGQLEDIEEEHSADLIKTFNALKNGCWIREGFYGTCYLEGKPVFIPNHRLHLSLCDDYIERKNEDSYDDEIEYQECLCLFDMYYEMTNNIARVQDYGKTWALTKEELL